MAATRENFEQTHPTAQAEGRASLFKFFACDIENEKTGGYLEHLFSEGKLYQSTPAEFNDPFECRPKYKLPTTSSDAARERKNYMKNLRKHGLSKKYAEQKVSKWMSNPFLRARESQEVINKSLAVVRLCCFTTSKSNLLMWSHYADAHKGICIEFSAADLPIGMAYKVDYQSTYPTVPFSEENPIDNLRPLLTKSLDWRYENEYRTMLVPYFKTPMPNDGISYSLPKNAISKIYFGVNTCKKRKEMIRNVIASGPFSPEFWQTKQCDSSFELKFEKLPS